MKAVVVVSLGSPEQLVLQEVPEPTVGKGEILVRVRYSGVNYAETLARRGVVPTPSAPFVMGLEVVGTVAAVGEEVEGFTLGQPVAAFTRNGYAQYAVASSLLAVPLDVRGRAVDAAKVIGLPCTGVTAHQLLTLVGKVSAGETVFVQGATGGVGTMLGQLAKALGAGKVIGSVGSASKIEFALRHGYDEAIRREEFPGSLRGMTDGRGVDLYLEGISGAHLASLGDVLAPLGRAVFFGDANFSSDAEIPVDRLRSGNLTLAGYSLGRLCATAPKWWRPSAVAVLEMIANGAIHDSGVTTFPPAEASSAHALLESRMSQGKLALDWGAL